MFTFSREFLEIFDRRFSDLLQMEGREFVFGARAWLLWLQTDVRTRLVCTDFLNESDEARRALGAATRKFLPEMVHCRNRLAAMEEVPADWPQPVPAGPVSAGGIAHEDDSNTFRFFDSRAVALTEEPCLRFLAFDPVTNPLKALHEVLSTKRGQASYRTVQGGGATKRSDAEIKSFFDRLEAWGPVMDRFTPELESVCLEFHASAGRALRILEELLVRGLTNSRADEPSWFAEEIVVVPDVPTSYSSFKSAILSGPRRGPASAMTVEVDQERSQEISQWVGVLRELARRLNAGLRERLGGRALLVSAIDRFRLRCELYDTEELRQHALRKEEGEIRQAELRVTQKLARYLFDAGFDVLTEVTAGVGRADLVQMGGVYVEAKQVSTDGSAKTKVIRGYTEACDGVRGFRSSSGPGPGVRAIVLAVYVFEGPLYEVPAILPAHGDVPEAYPIIIDLRDASQRGAKAKKGPVAIQVEEFLAGEKASRNSVAPAPVQTVDVK